MVCEIGTLTQFSEDAGEVEMLMRDGILTGVNNPAQSGRLCEHCRLRRVNRKRRFALRGATVLLQHQDNRGTGSKSMA